MGFIPGCAKRIYLAGPMTGYEFYNFPLFDEAQKYIEQVHHWNVVSPADHDRKEGFDPEDTLCPELTDARRNGFKRRDLRLISGVDAICLLPGWDRSPGAVVEATIGTWLGLERYYYITRPYTRLYLADQETTIDDSERGPDCAEERELAARNEAARLAKGGRHA